MENPVKYIAKRLRESKKLKEKRKEIEKDLKEKQNEILEQWKKVWKSENDQSHRLEIFYDLFVSNYEYVCSSKEFNKLKNEQWKKIFIVVVVIGIWCIVWIIRNACIQGGGISVLLENSIFLIPLVISGGVVSKWIDIKKYQETRARHSEHLHLLLTEMLKFISIMEPYDCSDRKIVFVKNILYVWDNNQKKFVQNMEEKEKGLMDIFEKIK